MMSGDSFQQALATTQWACRRTSLCYSNNNNNSNIVSGTSGSYNNINNNNSNVVGSSKIKLCGYLKKKRNKVGGWRKLWFVLQDKLLLSYGSKEEYDTKLVSFKDALNLMPGTMVRPLGGFRFTIETTTQAMYTFHCEDRRAYRDWITMLLESLAGGGGAGGIGNVATRQPGGIPYAPASGLASVGLPPAATPTALSLSALKNHRCGPANNFDALTQAEVIIPLASAPCEEGGIGCVGGSGSGYCVRLPCASKILERNIIVQQTATTMPTTVSDLPRAHHAATHRHTATVVATTKTTTNNSSVSACDLQEFRERYSQFPVPPTIDSVIGSNNNNNNEATARLAICRGIALTATTTTSINNIRPSSTIRSSSSTSSSTTSTSSPPSAVASSLLQSFTRRSSSTSVASRASTITAHPPSPASLAVAVTCPTTKPTTTTTTTGTTTTIKAIKQTNATARRKAGTAATNNLFVPVNDGDTDSGSGGGSENVHQEDVLLHQGNKVDGGEETTAKKQKQKSEKVKHNDGNHQCQQSMRCWMAQTQTQPQRRCSVEDCTAAAMQQQQQQEQCVCSANAETAISDATHCTGCKALRMVRERVQRLSVRGAREQHATMQQQQQHQQQHQQMQLARTISTVDRLLAVHNGTSTSADTKGKVKMTEHNIMTAKIEGESDCEGQFSSSSSSSSSSLSSSPQSRLNMTEPIYAVVDLRHKYAQRKKRYAAPLPGQQSAVMRATTTPPPARQSGLTIIEKELLPRCNSYDSIIRDDQHPINATTIRHEKSLSLHVDDIDGIYEDGDAFYQPMRAPLRLPVNGIKKDKLTSENDDDDDEDNDNDGDGDGAENKSVAESEIETKEANTSECKHEDEENIYEPINVPSYERPIDGEDSSFWRYFTRLKVQSILQLTRRLRQHRQHHDYDTIKQPKINGQMTSISTATSTTTTMPTTSSGTASGFSTIKRKFGTHRKSMQLRVRKFCTRAYEPPPLFKRPSFGEAVTGVMTENNVGTSTTNNKTTTTKISKHRWKSVKVRSKKTHLLTATVGGSGGIDAIDRIKGMSNGGGGSGGSAGMTSTRKPFFGSLPRMRRQRPAIAAVVIANDGAIKNARH